MNSKSLKDIAKEVRAQLKKEYPDHKFSVTTEYYSMGQSLHVRLMSAPVSPFADGSSERYEQLNHFYLDNYADEDRVHSPSLLMTAEGVAMLKRVNEIANSDNWDNSDAMTDYFDVNYHFDLHIGKWDRPFVATGQSQSEPETAVQVEPAPAIEQPEVVAEPEAAPVQPETAVQDDEPVKIVEIKAHGSELDMVNGMTFVSIEQADTVIVSLIKALGMGFAKTKITITWADGDTVTTDSDYCENETTRDTLTRMAKYNSSPLPEWLKRMGVTEEKHQARCEEWAKFVATHELP